MAAHGFRVVTLLSLAMPQIEGAGVALHYEARGDGPTVLVVHAMGSDAACWAPAVDELAAAGARAIAYDRRGYGRSGAPTPYVATTVQEQAQDAGALLEALRAAPALLVGDGFGALVVLELLVRRPELARGAVLADPPLHAFVTWKVALEDSSAIPTSSRARWPSSPSRCRLSRASCGPTTRSSSRSS